MVFRLSEKTFDGPTFGIIAQNVFVAQLSIGARCSKYSEDVLLSSADRLSSEQHQGIIKTVECTFVAIDATTFFPDHDEMSVVRFDIACKPFGWDGRILSYQESGSSWNPFFRQASTSDFDGYYEFISI